MKNKYLFGMLQLIFQFFFLNVLFKNVVSIKKKKKKSFRELFFFANQIFRELYFEKKYSFQIA